MVLIASFLVLTASSVFADDMGKVAYVDLSRLFDEHNQTKAYDKELEAKQKDFEKEMNARVEKIKDSRGKLALLKEDKRAELEAEIEKEESALLEYRSQKTTTLTKERNEKIREILLEIEKVVSSYAEKEDYAMILNDRVLVYGDPNKNITESILKILNGEK